MDIRCPKCKSTNIECDTPDKPYYFEVWCECGYKFRYDAYMERYYDTDGKEIK